VQKRSRLEGADRVGGDNASEMPNPKRVTVLFSVQYQISEYGSLKGKRL
jgi:hypothetical protein